MITAARPDLKIRSLDAVVVGAGIRNWVFVKVIAGEFVGWGEATLEFSTMSVVGALDDLRPVLVGADAMATNHQFQRLTRHRFWRFGIEAMSAISGVDQALHDIKAQALGVPIYELLGGAVRDRIRLYDHLGGGSPDAVYGSLDPARCADLAEQSVALGYDAVKLLPVPVSGLLASGDGLRMTDRLMAAIRETVGPDVDVMADFHGRTAGPAAVAYAKVLAPYRPWFIEEPVPPGDLDGLAHVAARVDVPIATGERLVGRRQFAELFQRRLVQVAQPDICHCGGYTELRVISELADVAGVAIAPHNPLGPIATWHSLHVAAATSNWIIQEQMSKAVPWFNDVVTVPFQATGGSAGLPVGPGLGTAVDEAACAQHPYVGEPPIAAAFLSDGSVADW